LIEQELQVYIEEKNMSRGVHTGWLDLLKKTREGGEGSNGNLSGQKRGEAGPRIKETGRTLEDS